VILIPDGLIFDDRQELEGLALSDEAEIPLMIQTLVQLTFLNGSCDMSAHQTIFTKFSPT